MQITRTSILTGIVRTRAIDIMPEEYAAWQKGLPLQDAAPHLSADDRAFLATGITPDEWEDELAALSEWEVEHGEEPADEEEAAFGEWGAEFGESGEEPASKPANKPANKPADGEA